MKSLQRWKTSEKKTGRKLFQDHHCQIQNGKKLVRYEKGHEKYLISMPLKVKDMILNLEVN